MWLLYQLATAAVLALAGPFLLLGRARHYLPTLRGRLGRGLPPPSGPAPLWIHAVSVGEVGVAATLVRALPAGLPLVVTTVTPTGQARARAAFGERATVTYLPFELAGPVRRFYRRYSPRALVLVEGDLWPLVLREARRRRLTVMVVNGRISDRSYRRLRLLRRWLSPLLDPVTRFAVQGATDRRRLERLGVAPERIVETGNLKFESPEPPRQPEVEELVERLAGGRPVLVAGSTMAGEDEQVVAAHAAAGGGADALLVLAPRHPERWSEVAELLTRLGVDAARRSERPDGRPAVLLLDSLGELAGIYRLAFGAFIGGTLVATGGHNPLEPARFGVPVAVGRSMENFADIAAGFDADGAWRRVDSGGELGAVWRDWLAQPAAAAALGERGRRLVAANRGALERTLRVVDAVARPPEAAAG